ncbi:MAG TPA: DUF6427 family protein [Parasegetibacter sp.]
MIGIFKQKNPGNLLVLLVYALALKFYMFLDPVIPEIRVEDGFLYKIIVRKLLDWSGSSAMIFPILTFILLFTQAAHLNRVMNNQRLMPRSNFLPGMSYILITSFFTEWSVFSAPLLVNSLLLLVWSMMTGLYNSNHPKSLVFNIGLLVGLSSFIFFPALAFILLVFFAMLVTRPFHFTEWLIAIFGIVTPYYFLFIGLFLFDGWDPAIYLPNISFSMVEFLPSLWLIASVSLLVIPFLIGGYYVQDNLSKMLIQIRKSWSLLLFYVLVSTVVPFINTSESFSNWILCAVPFAAFHACAYFYPRRGLVPLILHWLGVALVVTLNYFI